MKKLAFSPIVAIQGARQTGKSVLVRDLLPQKLDHLVFRTFDSPGTRDMASSRPESFLAEFDSDMILAIDEAQKVPSIFDVVKLTVDNKRRPGMYILLGSTQFSTLSGVRESLTGRMTHLRVFPFTLSEVGHQELNRKPYSFLLSDPPQVDRQALMRFLKRGGLPGVFSVRSDEERENLLEDWLALTCERDMMRLKVKNLDPVVARKVLTQIARLAEPSLGQIARAIKVDARKVQSHLNALETLFVVHPLHPHQDGTGKVLYFLLDVSFATLLGAGFERQLHTLTLQEMLAKISYLGLRGRELFYYRGKKGGVIHLVLQEKDKIWAIKILAEERIDKRELLALGAWKKKRPEISLLALGSQRVSLKKEGVEIYPWEAVG